MEHFTQLVIFLKIHWFRLVTVMPRCKLKLNFNFDFEQFLNLVRLSDVFVFGVSSLIILCSACIFLAGVIILKR